MNMKIIKFKYKLKKSFKNKSIHTVTSISGSFRMLAKLSRFSGSIFTRLYFDDCKNFHLNKSIFFN